MTKTYSIKRPITILRDDLILAQLPKSVLKKLGTNYDTGFVLGSGRRDYFSDTCVIQYVLGSDSITVKCDD